MATAAGSTSQEYWRPSNPDVARVVTSIRGTCRRCGTDYTTGARYCHTCGGARDQSGDEGRATPFTQEEVKSVDTAKRVLGLSLPCFISLVAGVACAVAAIMTGVMYKEDTLLDWQAVQAWRIEWLLAAIVALLAGVLLKRKNGST